MSELKAQLRADLKESMKAKQKERTGTIRMLLAAITEEETKGTKHDITDEEIQQVIAREIKKRRESAEVYAAAGRQELSDAELIEADILAGYQPTQLSDAELVDLVTETIAAVAAELGVPAGPRQMGQVMKAAQAAAAGRVDGKRLSSEVKAQLT